MKLQENFSYSLDVPANIISVCPNCHKLFHYATIDEKAKLIKYCHPQRKELLEQFGIRFNFEELLQAYT